MKVLNGDVTLVFGSVNDRQLVPAEAKKLLDSFKIDGIELLGEGSMIRLLVDPSWVDVVSLSQNYSAMEDELPVVQWTAAGLETKRIHALGGQHRLHALKKWIGELDVEIAQLEDILSKESRADSPQQEEESLPTVYEDRLNEFKARKESLTWWTVSLYDEGMLFQGKKCTYRITLLI